MKAFLLLLLVSLLVVGAHQKHCDQPARRSLGDALFQSATTTFERPITTAQAPLLGWTKANNLGCVPGLGEKWVSKALLTGAPVQNMEKPTALFFTSAGQLAGIQQKVFGGAPSAPQIANGWWKQDTDGKYYMNVLFRDPKTICSGQISPFPVGDRVIVQGNIENYEIPCVAERPPGTGDWPWEAPIGSEEVIMDYGWKRGKCFETLGRHFILDTTTSDPAQYTFNLHNTFPILVMYRNNRIDAILLFSMTVESATPEISMVNNQGYWDGVVDIPSWCLVNYCEDYCASSTIAATGDIKMSTVHFFFSNKLSNICSPTGCEASGWP